LTYSGWLTHITGYPSATGHARDREVRWLKDRRSTAVPRNQPRVSVCLVAAERYDPEADEDDGEKVC